MPVYCSVSLGNLKGGYFADGKVGATGAYANIETLWPGSRDAVLGHGIPQQGKSILSPLLSIVPPKK